MKKKYIMNLKDGEYCLIGSDGAILFHTDTDEALVLNKEGFGSIVRLEEYKGDTKMILRVICKSGAAINSVLEKIEEMYPDAIWASGQKPKEWIPVINDDYIQINLERGFEDDSCLIVSYNRVTKYDDGASLNKFYETYYDWRWNHHRVTKYDDGASLKKFYETYYDWRWEHRMKAKLDQSQNAKDDAGKPKLTLVPQQIIWDIAEVREYGNKKYGDPDNWKTVDKKRYRDAAMRHLLKYLADPEGVDEESGISHLKHLACNIAFLCEMEKEEPK